MSAEGTTRKRMGLTALISSIFIVATLVWGIYSFVLIQSGSVRPYEPHYQYDQIEYWPYTLNFTGGTTNWFEGMNYTDLPIDQQLPNNTLDMLDTPVFYVTPADPGQLWRIESYDRYTGSGWTKTIDSRQDLTAEELIPISEVTNTMYYVFFNATAGAEVGSISLPSLFPYIRVIENSFVTYSLVDGAIVPDVPSRLLHYDLETDEYGTLIFSPLIDGVTGEDVMISFQITFVNQDIDLVQSTARLGTLAPVEIRNLYTDLSLVSPLSQRVTDNISQFIGVGTNAYETAMAVKTYFQSTFAVNFTEEALFDRPSGQEVTDWFLERGNGLPIDFATAYSVFMRELNIPARVVSGYSLGEPHPTADMRTLMVRHMTFWVEVYIPMLGHPEGGEWIQVMPAPLPDGMGGGEDPTNTPVPELELLVGPTNNLFWSETGTPFGLKANISVDGIFITTPDSIVFYDETDTEVIGTAVIGASMPAPNANLSYTFPSSATIDWHQISATWVNDYFMVMNTTNIYAVGTPIPLASETPTIGPIDAILAETYELDINQGLTTHIAYWEDTVHVYGTMTVNGNPVNGSNHPDSRYIQIMWDGVSMGDAFIDDYGYYELDVYVDPLNFVQMTVGQHDVWSYYPGDWEGSFWRLYPANSTYTSTVTVWGRINIDLSVTPSSTYAGGTITYDGTISFLNSSLLPSGQTVVTFFHTQENSSRLVNVTGGFHWTYIIPVSQSDGSYEVRANFTSPWEYISGNWSISYWIDVGAGGTQIDLIPLPNPVFIGETVTVSGYLRHVSNSSGIGSQWVDVYWSAGSTIFIGNCLTAPDGYFEVSYIIPAGYEGAVTYWANFTSLVLELTDTESLPHLGTTVKRYDVEITIADNPDPIRLLQTVTIQGVVTLPENSSFPLASELVELYWANTTHPGGVLIDTTWTNSTGGYIFYYQVPLSHGIETVSVWVSFTSPYSNIASNSSLPESLQIEATNTLITVNSDYISYYLNETVLITGHLQFVNETPIAFQRVLIYWINGTLPTPVFEKFTDINGNYTFQYNLSVRMDTGLVNVHVNWTSFSGLYADAVGDLVPPIQLNRYDLSLSLIRPTKIFVDEDLRIQGVLTTAGGTPIVGVNITVAYHNTTDWLGVLVLTNSTGGFDSGYLPFFDLTDGPLLCVVAYFGTDPMVNNITNYFYVDRAKYAINIEITLFTNPVMQNGTLTIHAYLYFAHNSSPLVNADVSILWDNGTLRGLGIITTDGTGQGDLYYTGMDYDTVLTNIQVYGTYAGTILRANNESEHILLTIEQWESVLVGLNTPTPDYSLLDTVVVTGTLRYVSPSIPYGGATVELLVSGTPIDSTITASDGTFTLFWTIPSDTLLGDYDLEVRYTAPDPWILGVQDFVPTIHITAPGYIFVSFTVTPESPTPVIILDYLTISGVVTWDNGSPYVNSTVELRWGSDQWFTNVLTNGTGAFTTIYQVPGGTPIGLREVWAYIPPSGIVTFGESLHRIISVETHSLVITATVDFTTIYLGNTITITGTAHFLDGTPLTGYSIEIWWDLILLTTRPIDGSGNFGFAYYIPYSESVGIRSGFVLFNAPTLAFSDVTENFEDVEVRQNIYIDLSNQPIGNTFSRGDIITVTGTVTNDGGAAAEVEIHALFDGGATASTDETSLTGAFTIQFTIDVDQLRGQYIITVESIEPFCDVILNPDSWTVIVVIDSVIQVQATAASFMPGEPFYIALSLYDEDGVPINGVDIAIRIDTTLIETVYLVNGDNSTISVFIPSSWSNDGYFAITVEFEGSTFLNRDSDVSTASIHIFTDVVFYNRSPGRVPPGQPFTIELRLTDPELNVITNRPVLLNLNGTSIISLVTNSEGVISYDLPGYDGGVIRFSITLQSTYVLPVASGTFEILIQTQGGIILQGTDLIIAGVLLVGAVIAVLAYLYIVKGMFRSVVISRGIDIPTKLRNIKKLADAGKYGASITLAYRTFEQMCGSKLGSERSHSETAREYLDRVMQSIPFDAATVEQFVQTYEEARFSHHEMNRERYEAALRIFTDLYPRIDTSTLME